MPNILSIAQSGLAAAQAGLATTGHNIANQATPGYSRQQVVQSSLAGQNINGGYIGNGTNIDTVKRIYNDFLGTQAINTQSNTSQLNTYYTQINKINNMLASTEAGLTPAISDFFAGVQDLVANPGEIASRQAVLSGAESLAARLKSMNNQLNDMRSGVNSEISSAVSEINSYAEQIQQLNLAITKALNSSGQPPNDLLDQRDQLVTQLATQSKVTVVKQDGNFNIFIGNGQPLVVGNTTYKLSTSPSPSDLSRLEVSYTTNGNTVILPESSLTGGKLGGLFEYRSQTLDTVQNSLGRIAIGIAATFNAQHKLGQDQNGVLGKDFFAVGAPVINTHSANTGNAQINAAISDVDALTTSDYRVSFDGTNFNVTRLSDGTSMYSDVTFPTDAIDGVSFSLSSGTMATGDQFIVKPTVNGAADFNVLIKNPAQIATGMPVRTGTPATNTGTGSISTGTINSNYTSAPVTLTYDGLSGDLTGFPAGQDVTVTVAGVPTTYPAGTAVPYVDGSTVSFSGTQTVMGTLVDGDTVSVPVAASLSTTTPLTLTYDATAGTFSGFPAGFDVTVTTNGVATTYPAGTAVPYSAGASISFGGVEVQISGTPNDGDSFTVNSNANGSGDNRNILALGELQTKSVLQGGTASYNDAYSQIVSLVGNKTREVQVNGAAQETLLSQIRTEQQSESGVNLDEEATNLLRYQQAYQASGRVMQAVSDMFDVLISLGR